MGLSYPLQACYHGLYGVLYSHVYVLFEGVRFPSLALAAHTAVHITNQMDRDFYHEAFWCLVDMMEEATACGDDHWYHQLAEQHQLLREKYYLEVCFDAPSALDSADRRRLRPETD